MNCSGCGAALDSRQTFCNNCGRTVDDPHIGQLIAGHYYVEKRIAIGGFGSIYRGSQVDIGKPIALKIMHRELAADTNLIARFRREGEVLIKLRDQHTVATFEVGATVEGLPFIAMELLEGETLLRMLQLHGVMSWQQVFRIALQMCSALSEAHAMGIVHRDLKPGNIFLTDHGIVKVLDFGIAKILATSEMPNPQELTVMGTTVGTIEYMGPEQLMGGRADARTDIYTVGVLAFELITGRRPFNAVGLDLLTMQLTESAPAPSSLVPVPLGVDQVVLRCLAQDPEHRFGSSAELARALDAVLASDRPAPVPVARPATPLPTERPVLVRVETPLPMERPSIATEPVRRQELSGSSIVLVGVAIVLFVVGAGFLLAWLV